jgi:hypothetical protein
MARNGELFDGECTIEVDAGGDATFRRHSASSPIRGTSSVAARASGLLLFALLSFALACGDQQDPASAESPVEPGLTANFSCSNPSSLPAFPGETSPTIAQQICIAGADGELSPPDVNSSLSKLAKCTKPGVNVQQCTDVLKSFISNHWLGDPADLQDLLDAIDLAAAGVFGAAGVLHAGGDSDCDPSSQVCVTAPPGWSTVDRAWIATPISCSTLGAATSLDEHPDCWHLETVPSGQFVLPVFLVACYNGPAAIESSAAWAKVQDGFDDPNGTLFEDNPGIEYFPQEAIPAGTLVPDCSAAASLARTAGGPSGGGRLPVQAGQKGGGSSGLALQGGVGTRISSFSDWGFVDLGSATVQGTISSSGGGTVSGATVELFCESESTARLTTTSAGDGSYSFDNGTSPRDFLVGEDCEVKASASGFVSGSSGTFTVAMGLGENEENVQDVTLDPTTSISGVIQNSSNSNPVAGATVELFCGSDVTPRQTATSASGTGAYSFPASAVSGGFSVGNTCEVVASKDGFASGSSGDFTVAAGANVKNVSIAPLQNSTTTVRGAVRHEPNPPGCTTQCSSTLVGGADVTLTCEKTSGTPSSFTSETTTGSNGGSNTYGRYKFTQAPAGFGPGWQCTVSASFNPGGGLETGSVGPFAVVSGTNTVDLFIE